MTVTVLFHSYFKDLTGTASVTEELPEGSTIGDLVQKLHARFPKLQQMERSTLMAVGVEYQPREHRLQPGDEVSMFPPVQGG